MPHGFPVLRLALVDQHRHAAVDLLGQLGIAAVRKIGQVLRVRVDRAMSSAIA